MDTEKSYQLDNSRSEQVKDKGQYLMELQAGNEGRGTRSK